MELKILLAGFPGRSDRGALGWSTVAAVAAGAGTLILDTGSFGDRALLRQALRQGGIDPCGVTRLFLSHLHYDHCLNADLFPAAEILVSRAEWDYAHSDLPDKADDPFVPKCFLPYLASRRLTLVHDGQYIGEGLRVVGLPGHTPGCAGLLFEKQRLLFAADAIKNAHEFYHRDPGMTFHSCAAAIASMEKAASLATAILPGHDAPFTVQAGAITRPHTPAVRITSFTDWQADQGREYLIPD
jgi:glyoxylase-like metal-dependent hydrolase (beta-lactamase superfamily II)